MKLIETGLQIINFRVHLLDLEQPTMVVSMIQISDTLSSKLLLVGVTNTHPARICTLSSTPAFVVCSTKAGWNPARVQVKTWSMNIKFSYHSCASWVHYEAEVCDESVIKSSFLNDVVYKHT